MRVWILDPTLKTPYYDLDLTNALQEQGIDATLIASEYVHESLSGKQNLQLNFFFRPLAGWRPLLRKVAIARWGARLLVYLWDLWRFQGMLKRNPPDILHIQWTLFPRLDRFLFRRLSHELPIVLTIHNPVARQSLLAKLDDMVTFTAFADQVIVHAEQNRQTLLQRVDLAPEKVHIVPHGPLFEDIAASNSEQARQYFGFANDVPIILFFGIIKPYKGLHDLITAMPAVVAAQPNAQLIVAGTAQESLESYRQAIADYHLEAHVLLHARFIESKDVPHYFSASNVVCLPYREASQSGVLLSAYRFAKPVVVTAVGAFPESVDHGVNGFVVPVGDLDSLAQALIQVLSDENLQQQFGAHSRKLAQERFSWSTAAQKTVEIYRLAQAGKSNQ